MLNDAKPSPAALQIAPVAMMTLPSISFASLVRETVYAMHSAGASTGGGWNPPTCVHSTFIAARANLTTLARLTPYFLESWVSDIPARRSWARD